MNEQSVIFSIRELVNSMTFMQINVWTRTIKLKSIYVDLEFRHVPTTTENIPSAVNFNIENFGNDKYCDRKQW